MRNLFPLLGTLTVGQHSMLAPATESQSRGGLPAVKGFEVICCQSRDPRGKPLPEVP